MNTIKTLAVASAAAMTLASCGMVSSESRQLQQDSAYQPDRPISEIFNDIPVSEPDPDYGYQSVNFPYWLQASSAMGWPKETNRNCNSKLAALYRDGNDLVWANEGRCILGPDGGWTDQYAADDPVDDDNMERFEVDHIISTEEAWRSGARHISTEDREALSNDPLNLHTTSVEMMREKNLQGADGFIPEGVFRCEYVSRYIQVKDKYHLRVTEPEKQALSEVLDNCNLL